VRLWIRYNNNLIVCKVTAILDGRIINKNCLKWLAITTPNGIFAKVQCHRSEKKKYTHGVWGEGSKSVFPFRKQTLIPV